MVCHLLPFAKVGQYTRCWRSLHPSHSELTLITSCPPMLGWDRDYWILHETTSPDASLVADRHSMHEQVVFTLRMLAAD